MIIEYKKALLAFLSVLILMASFPSLAKHVSSVGIVRSVHGFGEQLFVLYDCI